MTESTHVTADGTLTTEDGWYEARCTCGFTMGQLPDLETTVDVLMEHAYDVGHREGRA